MMICLACVFALPEPAADIVFCFLICGIRENALGGVHLDQLAFKEKCSFVAASRGLLHVVSDNHDCVLVPEFIHEFFDGKCATRVKSAARLIHQENFGAHGNGACDAQTLLLAT